MRSFSAIVLFAGLVAAESTTYTTLYSTVTECHSTVSNCPARITSHVLPLTTKTVYTTRESTIYSCPPHVKNCPYESIATTTVVEAAYTTVCPVEEHSTTTSAPYQYPNTTVSWSNGPSAPIIPSGASPIAHQTTKDSPVTQSVVPVPGPHTTAPGSGTLTVPAGSCPSFSIKTISTSITTVLPTVIFETVSLPCTTTPLTTWANQPTTASLPTVTAGAASFKGHAAIAAAAGFAVLALA